jgi:3-hydroxyacyl-CoA dehydrogenase
MATNTSSISITQIERLLRIQRYWYALYEPSAIMKLVIRGYNTSDEVTKRS